MMISNEEPRKEKWKLRKDYIREKVYSIEEMWDCSWWDQFKNNVDVKNHVRTHFPFKKLLSANSLVQNIKNETRFGYVQCDPSIQMILMQNFSISQLFSKILMFPETILANI